MRGDVGGGVAVVTDSTASLPAGLVEATGIVVVPLDVVVDGVPHREGVDITTEQIVEALRAGASVRTAHPGPEAFSRAYARVAARGASEIVSVHISGELSGTTTSASLAAQSAPVPVHVLGLRPVLAVKDGRIDVAEKVRTSARARDRVIELAIADAQRRSRVEMAVHHLGDEDGAERVAERLRGACGSRLAAVHVAEISAVVGAHAGPGLLAVVVGDA